MFSVWSVTCACFRPVLHRRGGDRRARVRAATVPLCLSLLLWLLFFPPQMAWSDEGGSSRAGTVAVEASRGAANRLFVEAMQLIRQADMVYDPNEEARLLREADKRINDIIANHPDTTLAVQLISNQFVGDFDAVGFRNRLRGLACNERLSALCFLERLSNLLPPLESPITAARWDWLLMAVAFHHFGDPQHARELIAPFLAVVRRGSVVDASEPDLFVARALALTGDYDIALDISRQIPECASRIYNLADIALAASWRNETSLAQRTAEEARDYAARRACVAETGLVIQALQRVGREDDARTLYKQTVEQHVTRSRDLRKNCCPPELAVAAAGLGETNAALSMLRDSQDEHPWAVPAVLGRLARRGETQTTLAYAEQTKDIDVRAEAYTELVDAALKRSDRSAAEDILKRLVRLADDGATRRPGLLAQRARAEKLFYSDDRWRATFLNAIIAAERASSTARRDVGLPMLTALLRIETGMPLLD